jgi:hypothetical protein
MGGGDLDWSGEGFRTTTSFLKEGAEEIEGVVSIADAAIIEGTAETGERKRPISERRSRFGYEF